MNEIPAAFLFLCAAVAAIFVAVVAGLRRQLADTRRSRSGVADDRAPAAAVDRARAEGMNSLQGTRRHVVWQALQLAATLALLAVILLCAGLLLKMVRGS